jgi:glutamate:Na+ symporter, ESS family
LNSPPVEHFIPFIELDLIQTLAVASLIFYLGMLIRNKIKFLDKLNIPSAVVGGLIFAGLNLVLHDRYLNIKFSTTAQPLFMVLFFTTIGTGASLPLLRSGGKYVLIFFLMSTLFCFVQNFVGIGIASAFNVNPLLGIIAGSVTLVGGPATGLAFAPLFSKAGVVGADTLAITAATFGIVCGGILGGPTGSFLIRHYKLSSLEKNKKKELQQELHPIQETIQIDSETEKSNLMMNIITAAIAMGIGSIVSYYFQSLGWTLPAYIGAMLIASLFRNIDDKLNCFKINQNIMDLIGTISLNLFLVVALMDLKLWELVHLAIPLTTILLMQVIAVVLFSITISFRTMGKDYESTVIATGFIGFVLGTTANAIANMKTIVSKHGPAPKAFLVVPMVGAFFIDFTNAIIITLFINWLN